jgi:N-acetyl-gamma-glutamylphosphate reductase
VNSGQPGDLKILDNGTYKVDDDKKTIFSVNSTAVNHIIVKAKDLGEVTLEGSAGLRFEDYQYVKWYGFKHLHKGISPL